MLELPEIPELTLHAFHEWVQTLPDHNTVAIAATINRCPIAKFLLGSYDEAQVCSESIQVKRMNDRFTVQPPDWVQAFIFELDGDAETQFVVNGAYCKASLSKAMDNLALSVDSA